MFESISVLFIQLKFNNTSPIYNNNICFFERKGPEDEDLESVASDLDGRDAPDEGVRKEAEERIKRKFDVDITTAEGEERCKKIEKSLEEEFKRRKLERHEYNDILGVDNQGYSPTATELSVDSDHKALMEDEKEYIEKKKSEYKEENSDKNYSEEDALKYAQDSLNKLKDKYDNPDTDQTDTDQTDTDNEDERTSEPDTEDESSDLSNGLDKGSNNLTQIKDIVKGGKGGGSGSVSSGGSGEGGSNNNGGSDSGSNDFFTVSNFFFYFLTFIGCIAEYLECLFI